MKKLNYFYSIFSRRFFFSVCWGGMGIVKLLPIQTKSAVLPKQTLTNNKIIMSNIIYTYLNCEYKFQYLHMQKNPLCS